MRNIRPIDALFPKTRQQLLAATFGQPERWWYMSELASHLKTSPSSLQRELKGLVQSGILQQRREGKRVYFKAEPQLPFFAELRSLIEKTVGVASVIADALRKFGGDVTLLLLGLLNETVTRDHADDFGSHSKPRSPEMRTFPLT
jgi:DNA-binding transcriptional ArsR family regulator